MCATQHFRLTLWINSKKQNSKPLISFSAQNTNNFPTTTTDVLWNFKHSHTHQHKLFTFCNKPQPVCVDFVNDLTVLRFQNFCNIRIGKRKKNVLCLNCFAPTRYLQAENNSLTCKIFTHTYTQNTVLTFLVRGVVGKIANLNYLLSIYHRYCKITVCISERALADGCAAAETSVVSKFGGAGKSRRRHRYVPPMQEGKRRRDARYV